MRMILIVKLWPQVHMQITNSIYTHIITSYTSLKLIMNYVLKIINRQRPILINIVVHPIWIAKIINVFEHIKIIISKHIVDDVKF
jgi:hemoglobin-like flavoprotein